jgi:hypothetical protein
MFYLESTVMTRRFRSADAQCPLHSTHGTAHRHASHPSRPQGVQQLLQVASQNVSCSAALSARRAALHAAERAHRRHPGTWRYTAARQQCNARSSWCRSRGSSGSARGRRERAGGGALTTHGRAGPGAHVDVGGVRTVGWGDAGVYARGAERKCGRDGEECEAHRDEMEHGLDDGSDSKEGGGVGIVHWAPAACSLWCSSIAGCARSLPGEIDKLNERNTQG